MCSKAEKKWKYSLPFLPNVTDERSVLISSNLVFSQWDKIFQDPMTTMGGDRQIGSSLDHPRI
jgi:hypothetical protein